MMRLCSALEAENANLRHDIARAVETNTQLVNENAALRADKERLDAIEHNLWFVEPRYDFHPARFRVGKVENMQLYETLRAAIDAARKL